MTSQQTSPIKADSLELAPGLRDSNEERDEGEEESSQLKNVEIFLQQETAMITRSKRQRTDAAAPS